MLGSKPIRQTVRPLHPPLRKNLLLQLEDWIKDQVIEPSNSPWASSLIPVTKKVVCGFSCGQSVN